MQPAVTESIADSIIVHVGSHGRHVERRLPGARFVSVDDDLAAPPAPILGRHPLPTPEHFATVLERLGIDIDSRVVAYDEGNGGFAARLVWMLRIIGQDAALLDGGLDGWTGPTESGPATRPASHVTRAPVPWPDGATASADEVAAHIAAGGVVIDARDARRFAGEIEPIDAVAGHVPGAVNFAFTDNLVDGRLLDQPALAERFAAVRSDPQAIVYCGSGVTACHDALAIEAAGLPRPRVYVGSWSGWSTDPDRPIATGPA